MRSLNPASATRCRITFSAVGERQIFPKQTNRRRCEAGEFIRRSRVGTGAILPRRVRPPSVIFLSVRIRRSVRIGGLDRSKSSAMDEVRCGTRSLVELTDREREWYLITEITCKFVGKREKLTTSDFTHFSQTLRTLTTIPNSAVSYGLRRKRDRPTNDFGVARNSWKNTKKGRML